MICRQVNECYEAIKSGTVSPKCDNGDSCLVYYDSRTNAKCEENRKVYNLVNSFGYNVALFRVDGGMIAVDKTVSSGTEKCDYMYCLNSDGDDKTVILTELKGVDIRKAIKQLLSTLEIYGDFIKKFEGIYCRAVVGSSVPKIKADPNYVKLHKKLESLKRNVKEGNIKIQKSPFVEKYEELNK